MNREILFKGFHPCENGKDRVFINGEWINGKWVEGAYMPHYYSSRYGKIPAIFVNDDVEGKTYRYPIIPETVGQYTGLTDKNGKKIFEGDIIFDIKGDKHIVTWASKSSMFKCVCIGQTWRTSRNRECDVPVGAVKKVIGNIHSNSELLEVAE